MRTRTCWTTRDGAVLTVRPIDEHDFEIEKAFVEALSPQTRYRRLLSPRRLTLEEIERFTHIDPSREMAWIAVDESSARETLCGVARYVRDGPTAEWAIVLADAWQRRGLGRMLLTRVIDSAREAGVERLSYVTFATNVAMLALARELGFTITREEHDATLDRMTMQL